MKKKNFAAVLVAFVSAAVFAQVSVDPLDDFYVSAQSWYIRGVVESLPPIRPYPVKSIEKILEQVRENGTKKDLSQADDYYERIFGKKWYVNLEAEGTIRVASEETDDGKDNSFKKRIVVAPSLQGDITFFDNMLSTGYDIGINARTDSDELPYTPQLRNPLNDGMTDSAKAGPFKCYIDFNDVVAFGNENIFAQAGLYRTGYGAFLEEGLSLNEQAYHAGNFAATFRNGRFFYTQQLSVIGAGFNYQDVTKLKSNKFHAFHALGLDLFDWLTFSLYENAIFGNHFDPLYLAPVPYMAAQQFQGSNDGVYMGFNFEIRPFSGFMWGTDVLIDDFATDQFFKGDLDAKYRFAVTNGFVIAPADSFCDRIQLDYTIVSPYTYSHWEYDSASRASISADTVNYQNYTNAASKMGAQLEPNSDAVNLKVQFTPVKNLKIRVSSAFSRHGNVAESLDEDEALRYLLAGKDVYSTDGSIYMHSMFANERSSTGDHVDTAWEHLNLLNQDHKMYTFQFGLDVDYLFPKINDAVQIGLHAGGMFEYIKNYGVGNNMFEGGHVAETAKGSGRYTYNGSGNYTKTELFEFMKDKWEKRLSDRMAFYVTAGCSLRF